MRPLVNLLPEGGWGVLLQRVYLELVEARFRVGLGFAEALFRIAFNIV